MKRIRRDRPGRLRGKAAAALGMLTMLVCTVPAFAQPSPSPSAPSPTPAARAPRVWWNQTRFIDALTLTAEQRQAMDAALAEALAARRRTGAEYRAARGSFAEALSRGDWKAAAAERERLAELAARVSDLESALVLDVVRQLTETQRQNLNRQFPLLLRRPWLRGGPRERTPIR